MDNIPKARKIFLTSGFILIQLLFQACAKLLVLTAHVDIEHHHHRDLKRRIQPGLSYQQGEVQDDGTRIEGQDIGILHQRQTALTEIGTQLSRNFPSETGIHSRLETLETGTLLFLGMGIVPIEIEEEFPGTVLFPGQGMKFVTELLEVVEFRTTFPFQKIEVDVTVIVGQLALFAMKDKASDSTEHPDPDSPVVFRQERNGLYHQTETNGRIDGKEPDITGESIQNTSPASLLPRHTRQLSVGTIVEVGPSGNNS